MGHVNQSIAFAKHLEAEYQIISLKFRHPLLKILSYLLDKCRVYTLFLFSFEKPFNISYDFIVSTGSSTYYANKALAKKLKIKSVTMMLPKGYRYDFNLMFAQNHDNPPKQNNIIEIPANFSYVEPKGLFTPKIKSVGIIIGGSNTHLKIDKERIKAQLNSIFEAFKGYAIAVTTSPRTSKAIEELIESYPFAYSVIFSKNKINPIADFLAHCEVVFITIDSTSMISEAISYGTSCVEILPLDESKNNKFYTLAHTLENEDYAHIFDDTLGHKSKKIDFKQYAQKAFA